MTTELDLLFRAPRMITPAGEVGRCVGIRDGVIVAIEQEEVAGNCHIDVGFCRRGGARSERDERFGDPSWPVAAEGGGARLSCGGEQGG
ncbi:hypothetical protein [Pseudonocardia sp. T1-2H]|uniref:hypothetical protein n=1 Tax=Pseudonocardia sp. T1-2H TaxID=3128899 RepID=UPI003101483A